MTASLHTDAYTYTPLTTTDFESLTCSLPNSKFTHQHSDWLEPEDVFPDGFCYALRKDGTDSEMEAAIGFSTANQGYRWLQFFTVLHQSAKLRDYWKMLWAYAVHQPAMRKNKLMCIPIDSRMKALVEMSGFVQFGEIVYLEAEELHFSAPPASRDWTDAIQPLEQGFAADLAAVDAAAFPAAWQLSELNVRKAIAAASFANTILAEGQPLGYLIANKDMDTVHLSRIAVNPGKQTAGLGTALVRSMYDYAQFQEINRFSVNTYSGNSGAIQFYKSLGFQETSRTYPVFVYSNHY